MHEHGEDDAWREAVEPRQHEVAQPEGHADDEAGQRQNECDFQQILRLFE